MRYDPIYHWKCICGQLNQDFRTNCLDCDKTKPENPEYKIETPKFTNTSEMYVP